MAYPRIFQRLFANAGAGPLLRSDIIPRDIQSDSYRLSRIGCPHSLASTVLPPEYMWADGSLALLSDWPEFSARYSAGALTGMVMPYGSNQNVYMGKFMVNANGTGLYLPRLGGQFVRNWCPGQTTDSGRQAGSWQANDFKAHVHMQKSGEADWFASGNSPYWKKIWMQWEWDDIDRGATRAIGGSETRPDNIAFPITIYLGRHA